MRIARLGLFGKWLNLLLLSLFTVTLLVACNNDSNAITNRLERVTAPAVNPVASNPTAPATATNPTPTNSSAPVPTATVVASAPTNAPPSLPPTNTARPALPPIKAGVLLEPMAWEGQTWNNCGPMAAMMAVSYFGVKMTQEQARLSLRPNSADKLVKPEEMVSFIEKQGLKVVLRENGSLDKIRTFLSAGIPVITMQWLTEDEDIAHYRTARGYDTASKTFVFNDSMGKGPKTVVSADEQDRLWKAFNRRYFAVYTAAQEGTVMAILGEEADPQVNLRRAFEAAKTYASLNPSDIDAWRNLGYMTYTMGDYAGAAQIWEQKITKMVKAGENGPYSHFLWYDLWPLESYNKLGRYQEVIKLAPNEIAQTKAYAEARYQYAIALSSLDRKTEAIAQLKAAMQDDPNFLPAQEFLAKLGN